MESVLGFSRRVPGWGARPVRALGWAGTALLLASLLVPPSPAAADENAEARIHFEQGNRHLSQALRRRGATKRRLLEQALDAYVSSLGIVRSRNVVYNAGIALEELRRYAQAFTYFQEYLRFDGLAAEEREEATGRLDSLRPRIAVLLVVTTPPGVEVRVDRRDVAARGETPMEVAVTEGSHRLFLSLSGYHPREVEAAAGNGERVPVSATLEPVPVLVTVRAPDTGRLTIDGAPMEPGREMHVVPGSHVIRYEPAVERRIEVRPGDAPIVIDLDVPDPPGGGYGTLAVRLNTSGRVTLDGTVVGEGALVEARVSAGRHRVVVDAPGRAPVESRIDVGLDEVTALEAMLVPRTEGETRWGVLPTAAWIATLATGAAAVGVGIYALDLKSDYDGDPGRDRDLYGRVRGANLAADVLGVAALVLGATALGLTLTNDEEEQPSSTLILSAVPQPGGGAVLAEIEWGGL